jgi:Glycosyl transferase family 8
VPDRVSICLLSNAAYAAPTAVVAAQIAAFHDAAIEGIYFFWVEENAPPQELIRFLAPWNVRLVQMPKAQLDKLSGLGAGRLPAAAFARMLLAQIMPADASADRFVYLDGDIDVRKTLGGLANIALPDGFIATADGYQDVINTQTAERRVRWKADMAKLGLSEQHRYFNNGVIASRMSDWATIGPAALDYFRKNSDTCPFLDQDALNAVCRDTHVTLSPRYNFQRAYFAAGVFEATDPHVVHFHGKLKPWSPIPFHWTWDARRDFVQSFAAMPTLWPLVPPKYAGFSDRLATYGRAWVQSIQESTVRAGYRRDFEAYCANTPFADQPRG